MKVLPVAEFTSTLPDDAIEDEYDFVQWPGKSVAEAITEIFQGLGCDVDGPHHAHELGWECSLKFGRKSRFWFRVTLIDRWLFVLVENKHFSWPFRRDKSVYPRLLSEFADVLDRDPRFSEVLWYANKDVHTGKPGAARPVVADDARG